MASIVIVDEDELTSADLSLTIGRMDHLVCVAGSLQEGRTMARDLRCDLVILESQLPDGSGVDWVSRLRGLPNSPEVIVYTNSSDKEVARQSIASGAWDHIEKGDTSALLLSMDAALQYRREKRKCKSADDLVNHGIMGSSEAVRVCLDLIAQASSTDANVLISGETGTGKELFAQAIHRNSRRSQNNMVVIDCASLPPTLIESVLFGHEKGSFTGADRPQEGLFKQADGGTLFLDEVGELPLTHQKAFLRILQERRFRPIGSRREEKSDFRLIAATNRNLDKMAQEGEFRQDLLFRLRSFLIIAPPLRERLEDIDPIVESHMLRLCKNYGIGPKQFSTHFFDALKGYSWPGNVRELIGAIETAITTARQDPVIYPRHLPTELRVQLVQMGMSDRGDRLSLGRNETSQASAPSDASPSEGPAQSLSIARGDDARSAPSPHRDNQGAFIKLKQFLDNCETQYLKELLEHTGGNMTECGRISGLSRARLYVHLKELGLSSFSKVPADVGQ
jgi:two-component system NtrC family response regulator